MYLSIESGIYIAEAAITQEEMFKAIRTLQLGKTPRCDGLTVESCVKYWEQIKDALHEAHMYAYDQGYLYTSQHMYPIN